MRVWPLASWNVVGGVINRRNNRSVKLKSVAGLVDEHEERGGDLPAADNRIQGPTAD